MKQREAGCVPPPGLMRVLFLTAGPKTALFPARLMVGQVLKYCATEIGVLLRVAVMLPPADGSSFRLTSLALIGKLKSNSGFVREPVQLKHERTCRRSAGCGAWQEAGG